LTGPVAKGKVDGRSALGSNLYFVPRGVNEQVTSAVGLTMLVCQDRGWFAKTAQKPSPRAFLAARRAAILRVKDGENWFERRPRMLANW
jgi:hypothetical protein